MRIACVNAMTAKALADALGGGARLLGDPARAIRSVAPIEEAGEGCLTFSKAALADVSFRGAVVIVPRGDGTAGEIEAITQIAVSQPRTVFIRALHILTGGETGVPGGVDTSASVAPDARIGRNVHIAPHVSVGRGAIVGDDCVLHAGVRIYDGVEIGDGCIVQANAVIGGHGQAYVRDEQGRMLSMPHYSGVRIGARCRIGAGASIVRGTLRDTLIGDDTSVGNMANVGHNVSIGARCFIGPGALLAGSTSVGDNTWISIGAIVRGVAVGRNVMVGAGAVVTRAVADAQTVNGFPARVTATQG